MRNKPKRVLKGWLCGDCRRFFPSESLAASCLHMTLAEDVWTTSESQDAEETMDKCETCADPTDDPRDACHDSRRTCGHHCNHALVGSGCDWCGREPYGEQQDCAGCDKPVCVTCGEQAERDLAVELADVDPDTADRLGLR